MKTGNILIVDDNKSALSALNLLLQYEFNQVVCISNPNQIQSELRKHDFDVALLDMNFSAGLNTGNEGLYWLGEIKKWAPSLEVVMITAYGDVELAVKALKRGAADFITKPWDNEKLLATLMSAVKLRKSNLQVEELKGREVLLKREINKDRQLLIGSSPAMQKVMQMVNKVAKTDANVLITGENGTGKELIAREIHNLSDRAHELLVTVDMGAIPENLFESELFGHKKGAFTDAREDRIGKFQLANKGTLFLDEIGNVRVQLQSKLLVALQNRFITPVGSNKQIPIDIRLISATNSNLEDLVTNQHFRQDLLYRINTIKIELPPLRDRGEDVELLSTHFLKMYQQKYKRCDLRLGSQALRKLNTYHWPGNVRELQHTIEKAVILSDSDVLTADDFILKPMTKPTQSEIQTLSDMERDMIVNALDKYNGNFSVVAEKLGITRQTLYNKIKRYEL
jgi:DNA-binding NtrC family response regulator